MSFRVRHFDNLADGIHFLEDERPLIKDIEWDFESGDMTLIFYDLDGKLRSGEYTEHRDETGAPVAADPALNPGVFPADVDWLDAAGCATLIVYPIITGGGTVQVQPVFLDEDVLPSGAHVLHTTSTAISSGEAIEVACYSSKVFMRISAVTGAPTNVKLRVACGDRPAFLETFEE